MNMKGINDAGSGLIRGINYAFKKQLSDEDTIKTTRAASSLAVAYEAARNAVEFRSEHLIRQAAIVRILRRRLILKEASERVAPILVRELIWARYLKDDSVPVSKVGDIENIIDKYQIAFKQVNENNLKEWLLELAGCEIEESLVFNPYPQLLINFVAESLQPRIKIFGNVGERFKDIQVYIAVERAFAKNSEIYITYHLLKGFLPEWLNAKSDKVSEIYPKLLETKKEIDKDLNYSLSAEIKKEISKMSPPFNLIREMVIRNPEEFVKNSSSREDFNKAAEKLLEKLYSENRNKTTKASTRSIIYIFLTKMILGIALEFPFDLIIGTANYLALLINMIFPPALMFLLNIKVVNPDAENSNRILKKVNEYIYSDKEPGVIEIKKRQKAVTIIGTIFWAIYGVFFIGVFAFIVWGLGRLHFNPVSQAIFIFFVCVVSFFAYRVKSMSKEYVYQESREGILSSFIDFLFLPMLKVGQWLSGQIAKLNVLGFIFDFIIEAPLKAFLEVIEEWVHFVRAKKEEIFSE